MAYGVFCLFLTTNPRTTTWRSDILGGSYRELRAAPRDARSKKKKGKGWRCPSDGKRDGAPLCSRKANVSCELHSKQPVSDPVFNICEGSCHALLTVHSRVRATTQ